MAHSHSLLAAFHAAFRAALVVLAIVAVALLALTRDAGGQERPSDAVARAIEAQERHVDDLFAPGVRGTGVGIGADGRPVIRVYAQDTSLALPAQLDGTRVEVVPSGPIVQQGCPTGPTAHCDRPVPIGVSTGHPSVTAGTIGVRVTDGTNVYALSNNHVFAKLNTVPIGQNVIQPGAADGGTNPADAIGTLYDFQVTNFTPDCMRRRAWPCRPGLQRHGRGDRAVFTGDARHIDATQRVRHAATPIRCLRRSGWP